MKKTKRLVISTISIFIIILGLITISNTEVTFAQEDNVFYIDELNEGDFIPNGATLIGAKNYYTSSMVEKARIILSAEDADENSSGDYKNLVLISNSTLLMEDYKTYFTDSNEEYAGWYVTKTHHEQTGSEYTIYLLATKTYSKVEVDENYEIKLECDNSEPSPIVWYKSKDVSSVKINTNDDSVWTEGNGTYGYTLPQQKTEMELASYLKIEFDCKRGDILTFDAKQNHGEIEYIFEDNADYVDVGINKYEQVSFPIETSGTKTFIIDDLIHGWYDEYYNKYQYLQQYFSIKNIKVLTPLNPGEKLDESLVENGDTLYYECGCSNGTRFRNKVVYKKETPEVINPETNSNMIYLIVLLGIFTATAILVKYNSDKLHTN